MDNTLPIQKWFFFFQKHFKRASSFHKRQECTNNGHCGKASKILHLNEHYKPRGRHAWLQNITIILSYTG